MESFWHTIPTPNHSSLTFKQTLLFILKQPLFLSQISPASRFIHVSISVSFEIEIEIEIEDG